MSRSPFSSKYDHLIDEVWADLSRASRTPLSWTRFKNSKSYLIYNPKSAQSSGYFVTFGEDDLQVGVSFGAVDSFSENLKEFFSFRPGSLSRLSMELAHSFDELMISYWSTKLGGERVSLRASSYARLRQQAREALFLSIEGIESDLALSPSEAPLFVLGASTRNRISVEEVVKALKKFEPLFSLTLQAQKSQAIKLSAAS